MFTITDIPLDAMLVILKHLSLDDLLRLCHVSHKFRDFAMEDGNWELQCRAWFRRNTKHTGLGNVSPDRLRQQLKRNSCRDLYKTLKSLGGWPEGLYYRLDAARPHGALVWIYLQGSALQIINLDHVGRKTGTYCEIAMDATPIELYIGLRDEEHVTFPIKGLTINSNADTLMLELPLHPIQTWGQENSGPVAVWHDGKGKQRLLHAGELTQTSLVHGLYWNPLFSDWTAEPHPSLNPQQIPQLRLKRMLPLPPFSVLPHPTRPLAELSDEFTPAEALKRLPGLWTACYGSHGHEILHVWFEESNLTHNGAPLSEASSPGRSPRPRLIGCKVTGDANVPANQWSFVAKDFTEMRRGRWDGQGSWANPGQEYRHIVKFDGLPALVDIEARNVQARFYCEGCINHDPAVFNPQWTTAQLILYEGPHPRFSVLFDDVNERFRHIMDFTPVPLPCAPSLSWLSEASA